MPGAIPLLTLIDGTGENDSTELNVSWSIDNSLFMMLFSL
jgi:hypothetical protein